MLLRRLITIPAYLGLTAAVTAALPILVLAAAVATLFPGFRGSLQTLFLMLGYLWCETIGILSSFHLWLRYRHDRKRFLEHNFRLQCRWAGALKQTAEWLFDLRFEISGTEALDGPPVLMLPRHASIADTFIPMVYYATPRALPIRYVLKQELLFDPCLDIVGNRLPNLFVDRGGQDSEAARQDVARLVAERGPSESVLLYVEGTRYSRAKITRLRNRRAGDPAILAQLERWPDLLPPRLGGFLAALEADPTLDLLFCAHVGFEGGSRIPDLLRGEWRSAAIAVHFWRIDHRDIPSAATARQELLFQQWDQMQQWVSLHLRTKG